MAVTITKPFISQNLQNPFSVYGYQNIVYGYQSISLQKKDNENAGTQVINGNSKNINGNSKNKDDFHKNANSIKSSDKANSENKSENKDDAKEKGKTAAGGASNTAGLTEKELRILEDLKARDTKVRRHEMAHIAAGGQYITSGAHYQYEKGPDGHNYAVAGDVSIDTSPVPGDPEATIAKMRKVRQAALAPAEPSSQDKKVAAESSFIAAKALSELMIMQAKQRAETRQQQFQSSRNPGSAAKAYEKAGSEPVQKGVIFNLAA